MRCSTRAASGSGAPLIVWFHSALAGPVVVPKSYAHMSPFSSPAALSFELLSHQPVPNGSVMLSLCSWLVVLTSGSDGFPFG